MLPCLKDMKVIFRYAGLAVVADQDMRLWMETIQKRSFLSTGICRTAVKKLDGRIPMVYFLPIVENLALVILRVTS